MGLCTFLPSCSTVKYLIQATRGQLEISNRARPIERVVKDPLTPPKLKSLLNEIAEIKQFGETQGLKPTGNYTEFVDLKRPAAVWVVSACQPLEFQSKTWSFPIVGSFTYLGWFDLEAAKEHAERLRAEGLDVDLRGASAFSTLGWFKDPVLSTMISEGDEARGELIEVVLHESVHATFYIDGQSTFNESLAQFVAEKLTPQYMHLKDGAHSAALKKYLEVEESSKKRVRRLHEGYEKLSALYLSGESNDQKTQKKKLILEELSNELAFRRPLNNATIIQYKTYDTGMNEFSNLFDRCGRDWARFWDSVKTLNSKSFESEQVSDIDSTIRRLGC